MDRASISRIEEWDSRPVSGGYVGLNELADASFTGAVESGGARLLMLNGRVIGVFDGTISAFEDGDVIAYEAPDPSLPLLIAMQERGGEVRGKYYTDDTPLKEVDETLTSGGFTGYLELAENVLSGDYYVVYYGGRSLSAAFVGNEARVVTGDEAFELAADEVGIYEVRSVDLEVQDVPEPSEDAVAAAAETGPADEEHEADVEPEETDEESDDADASDEAEEDAESEEATSDDGEDAPESETDEDEPTAGEDEPSVDDETAPEPDGDVEAEGSKDDVEPAVDEAEAGGPDVEENEASPNDAESSSVGESPGATERTDDRPGTQVEASASAGTSSRPSARPRREQPRSEPDERFEEEARWREARTVPALDPEESEQVVDRPSPNADHDQGVARETPSQGDEVSADVEAVQQRIERLEAELEASEQERRRLTDRLEDVVDDRNEIEAERATLADRIESLEARIEQAEKAAAEQPAEPDPTADDAPTRQAASTGGSAVDPETALNQTDLFVRYGSKGKATLSTAHDGRAGAEEVAENLRIETHSRFDASTARVGGRPFDSYLEGTIQYRFVAWLVEELLYEIQETGTEAGLRDLYDVLPKIDRAEFNGTVVHRDEEGEEQRQQFDVICRDRMGKPLVVANINDSLDPATGDMMAQLVEDGTAAGEAHESMGAAFLVTASFFEPNALETAAEATRGGGFLSRDSKKSFVKLARNGGYHLCLVEARGDDFHVAVPEF